MKRIISATLIATLIFPAYTFAADPIPSPKITSIAKDQKAPFAGVLFNPTAAAQIFAERDFTFEECKLKIDFELDKERAKYNLLLDSTRASLEGVQKKYESVNLIKDKEIDRLSKIALKKENNYSALWATGGFVLGVALTIGMFYVASDTVNQ